jgi:hypothetical protein
MAAVDANTTTGLALLEDCATFVSNALTAAQPADLAKAWADFILGKGPLTKYDGVEALMRESSVYGPDTKLGDLGAGRRVIIQTGRMSAPWRPRIYDSADHGDASQLLYDVALRSGSLPMGVGVRDGEVDGAVLSNNPLMSGLARAVGGGGYAVPVPLEIVRVLSLGADDGSSHLSDLLLPGGLTGAAARASLPEQDVVDEQRRQLEKLAEHLPRGRDQIDELLASVVHHGKPLISPKVADVVRSVIPVVSGNVHTALRRLGVGSASTPPTLLEWGWPQWLASPDNPAYLLQVFLNSEGRGVAAQCADLIADRALRLAPVGLLSTNAAVLLLLVGQHLLVEKFGRATAQEWEVTFPGWLEDFYGFDPSFQATMAWVATQWM